jgi:hypothetical protein
MLQVAVNRSRVASLLQRVVDDLPAQEPRTRDKQALEAEMRAYLAVRGVRWEQASFVDAFLEVLLLTWHSTGKGWMWRSAGMWSTDIQRMLHAAVQCGIKREDL